MLNPSQTFIEIYNESLRNKEVTIKTRLLNSNEVKEKGKKGDLFKRFILYIGSKIYMNYQK